MVVSRDNPTHNDDESEVESSDEEVRGDVDEGDSDESDSEKEDSKKMKKQALIKSPTKRLISGREKIVESLLQNPREFLVKANAVVFNKDCLYYFCSFNITITGDGGSSDGPQYIQLPSAEDYEPEEEEKTPEYHGEPVPSDDEIDFFELAAGRQKPKKKKEIIVEEEQLPSDESIEPDYCMFYYSICIT